MARKTPCVKGNVLVYFIGEVQHSLRVESQEWWNWLKNGGGLFRFEGNICHFTARRESRQGNAYWYAYRTKDNKKDKAYLGKSEDLTLKLLYRVADELVARGQAEGNTAFRASVDLPFMSDSESNASTGKQPMAGPPQHTDGCTSSGTQSPAILLSPLTKRELEVLKCLVNGMSNKEIAQCLVLEESTIKGYLTVIYSKLGVSSRTKAIVRARGLDLTQVS